MLNPKELLSYTKDLSVLFVEDHEDTRENTSEILRNFFHTVDSVENGEVGLKQYKNYYDYNSKHYDIVLSDIYMPRMNGVSLVEYIYGINSKQKVLILSAYDDSKYLLPLINLGIEQFIQKPIDYQDLLQSLLNVSKNIKLSKTSIPQQSSSKLINFDSSCTFNKDNDLLTQLSHIKPNSF